MNNSFIYGCQNSLNIIIKALRNIIDDFFYSLKNFDIILDLIRLIFFLLLFKHFKLINLLV